MKKTSSILAAAAAFAFASPVAVAQTEPADMAQP